jgi:hypothetical protein
VGVLDFGRGAVVERGVQALVVPPPHPFQGRELDLLDPWEHPSPKPPDRNETQGDQSQFGDG